MRVLKSSNNVTLKFFNNIFTIISTKERYNVIQTTNAVVALEYYNSFNLA